MSPHNRRKAVFVEPQQKIGWQIAVEWLGGQPFPAWTWTQTFYCVPVSDDLSKRCWSRGSAVGCLMTANSTLVRHLQHAGCSAWPPLLAGIKIVRRWSPSYPGVTSPGHRSPSSLPFRNSRFHGGCRNVGKDREGWTSLMFDLFCGCLLVASTVVIEGAANFQHQPSGQIGKRIHLKNVRDMQQSWIFTRAAISASQSCSSNITTPGKTTLSGRWEDILAVCVTDVLLRACCHE